MDACDIGVGGIAGKMGVVGGVGWGEGFGVGSTTTTRGQGELRFGGVEGSWIAGTTATELVIVDAVGGASGLVMGKESEVGVDRHGVTDGRLAEGNIT